MTIEIDIAVVKVIAALEQRRLSDAVREALPISKTMFPPDPWTNVNSNLLSILFGQNLPSILGLVGHEDVQPLRVATGLHILGFEKASKHYLFEKVQRRFRFANDVTVRMTASAAYHRRRLEQFREMDVKKARVKGIATNGCTACRAIDGRVYHLHNLPTLPYEKCTCESGCRCTVLAVMD